MSECRGCFGQGIPRWFLFLWVWFVSFGAGHSLTPLFVAGFQRPTVWLEPQPRYGGHAVETVVVPTNEDSLKDSLEPHKPRLELGQE